MQNSPMLPVLYSWMTRQRVFILGWQGTMFYLQSSCPSHAIQVSTLQHEVGELQREIENLQRGRTAALGVLNLIFAK